jgi:hypothetical protein
MEDRTEIDEFWEDIAAATQVLLDGCLAMDDATRDDYVDGLFDALMGVEQDTDRFSIEDPTTRLRAHAMVKRFLPALTTVTLAEFAYACEGLSKLGNEAQLGGRTLLGELVLRIVAAFDVERERRGFKSYGEMRETVAPSQQPTHQEQIHDGTVH